MGQRGERGRQFAGLGWCQVSGDGAASVGDGHAVDMQRDAGDGGTVTVLHSGQQRGGAADVDGVASEDPVVKPFIPRADPRWRPWVEADGR